ncbi:MAG: hypothetical protein Q7S35_09765 [Candidatus Limnocylindrales bacterium]|nr:hypothetical protein [Candidatus Limnocylindrales bacterium]
MPFDFLRRRKESAATPASTEARPKPAGSGAGLPFEAMTEDWRLVGRMLVDGRLSDSLNKREPIALADVQWAPMDGSERLAPAPGLKSVDPYDLVLVLAGEDSLPEMTEAERSAHKIHKVTYEVGLEIPPYRVVGTVQLYPGYEPLRLLDRSNEMFIAVVNATATMAGKAVSPPGTDVILVNRAYLRGVEQVDARTGERYEKLPGGSLGGAQWTDKTR